MESDEKIVRIESLDEFDRELGRDGGEALEVPASLAEEYGLIPASHTERAKKSASATSWTGPSRARNMAGPRRVHHRSVLWHSTLGQTETVRGFA